MNLDPVGAALALLLPLALLALLSWWRDRRPLSIAERIAPFVPGTPAGQTALHRSSLSVLRADRTMRWPRPGGADGVRARHSSRTVATASKVPASSLVWPAVGCVIGVGLAALASTDDPRPAAWLVLAVTGGLAGRLALRLHRRALRIRDRRTIEEQVPVLADLLALAVSAGASPVAGLDRAAAVLRGPLADRINDALARIRSGAPLVDGLEALGVAAQVSSLTRLLDALATAHARGTPLTEVMRAQAMDARAEERRRLLEVAGRKDVAMLVPIVFLVLPTVILIAVFPGLRALEVVVP